MANVDISVIRPEMRLDDVKLRREPMSDKKLRKLARALRAFHTLETMASNIYKFQITRRSDEHSRLLIVAMANEMTHIQDFQVKLYEYGLRPSKIRWIYWLAGLSIGLFSRLLGRKAVLKAGIWVEKKAIHHYANLLAAVDWDGRTRAIILKDQADEVGHLSRWKNLIENGGEGGIRTHDPDNSG